MLEGIVFRVTVVRCNHGLTICIVVVVVFTLETVLTSIQYLLFLTLQGKETYFRGHKLTQNKVQKNKDKIKKFQRKPKLRYRKIKIRYKKYQRKSQHLRKKYDTGF